MASEDLGYWTFRGSDIRVLLFYLSGDVQGAEDSPRVSEGKERREEGQGGGKERGGDRDKGKEKERGGTERNEVNQSETQTRESEREGNEERRRED